MYEFVRPNSCSRRAQPCGIATVQTQEDQNTPTLTGDKEPRNILHTRDIHNILYSARARAGI
jgi:hypothetical protein